MVYLSMFKMAEIKVTTVFA